jgi:hypothetical protein
MVIKKTIDGWLFKPLTKDEEIIIDKMMELLLSINTTVTNIPDTYPAMPLHEADAD